MTGKRPTGMVPAMLLLASLLPSVMAQTPIATIILPTSLPASCTPSQHFSASIRHRKTAGWRRALNEGDRDRVLALPSHGASSATPPLDHSSLCDFIISDADPVRHASATSALSSLRLSASRQSGWRAREAVNCVRCKC
ncbi:hypothetical protein NUW58_g8593 [Xylaria curta]|uniref:Uncharacterized protein n=1 Tax=Xylaria curta TaxID=42375 RepID=A0ACC1N705_9PEZI|nr:hypothetical protein NUW58_g8593 [Xylaria curta]